MTGHDIMTCRDICHISRHALTFAWAVATWHEGDVTKVDAVTRLGAGDTLVPRNGFRIQSDAFLGSSLIYILDPIWWIRFWIRSDIHHTLHFLIQLSQHTRTHSRGGALNDHQMLRAAVASLWWEPLLSDPLWWDPLWWDPLCSDPSHPPPLAEKAQVHWERLWGEYPPSFYQQIFLSCQWYLFWGGRCTSCMMMIASCSDCHHTVVTWPSSIYIGFQCPLIRSSLLLLL